MKERTWWMRVRMETIRRGLRCILRPDVRGDVEDREREFVAELQRIAENENVQVLRVCWRDLWVGCPI